MTKQEALAKKAEAAQAKIAKKQQRSLEIMELPEILTIMMKGIEEHWNDHDKKRRTELRESYLTNGYREFIKDHTNAEYKFQELSDEQIEKKNKQAAEDLVLDLQRRVKEKVGNIQGWSEIKYEMKALNGFVTGDKGTAEVRSILAGGHSIQKLHVRVLVI